MLNQLKKIIKKIVPQTVINWYHYCLVFLAAFYYGFPSKDLIVIGITGTKGKTTVAELLNAFLEAYGKKTAMINSLRFKIDKQSWANDLKMTMPGRFVIQKFLADCKKQRCYYVILEVTSEGIKQFRHKFINFDMAVFLNLQPEHLEAHGGSIEKYCAAKEKLFAALDQPKKNIPIIDQRGKMDCIVKKKMVVNLDDNYSERFLKYKADEKIGFALEKSTVEGINKTLRPESYQLSAEGIRFKLLDQDFFSPLKGKFNLYNLLAALSAASGFCVPLPIIRDAMMKFDGLPGRFEEIKEGQNFKIFIDFAHTPDSLKAVYETLRSQFLPQPKSRLICVLSATGGGRDKWKRPKMGEVAAEYCDEIIITDEDPYDEDPKKIMKDIAEGVKNKNKKYQIIEDRRQAISEALKLCQPNDCLIVTGKGAEHVMVIKDDKKIPWDDRVVTREELKKILHQNDSATKAKI
ncbi:MAG TPA: UDP-N-acetylmuramoyl-L-alanyl-D-glutamate--2,6-diaminopimelate ligase [Candidatus Paceibacterota bacterium]|nr:UDP-N-acetylmuramoyl-L-alanyl-D-glutamate--2,6-diaminopimelate ligase [Candidatus Paceibacterota bacterium]